MLGFDGEFSEFSTQILTFLVKNRKISAVKHFIEKPISLNFVNLSTTFVQDCRYFSKTLFTLLMQSFQKISLFNNF